MSRDAQSGCYEQETSYSTHTHTHTVMLMAALNAGSRNERRVERAGPQFVIDILYSYHDLFLLSKIHCSGVSFTFKNQGHLKPLSLAQPQCGAVLGAAVHLIDYTIVQLLED